MDDDFFRDKFVISTHALREEGDLYTLSRPRQGLLISTHALREEGDDCISVRIGQVQCISTHALREEGDLGIVITSHFNANFYPRPPRGGRQIKIRL